MYESISFIMETGCVLCAAGFSSHWPGVGLGSVRMRFLTEIVALGQYLAFPLSVSFHECCCCQKDKQAYA